MIRPAAAITEIKPQVRVVEASHELVFVAKKILYPTPPTRIAIRIISTAIFATLIKIHLPLWY